MTCKERLTEKAGEQYCVKDYTGVIMDCETLCGEVDRDCDKCCLQKAYNKLGELEDKLENGTLIDVPCKVGDTVYDLIPCISSTRQKKYRIRQSVVKSIYNNQIENESICLIYISVNGKLAVLNKNAFGFTAFLTKEEAEARLKELQNEL